MRETERNKKAHLGSRELRSFTTIAANAEGQSTQLSVVLIEVVGFLGRISLWWMLGIVLYMTMAVPHLNEHGQARKWPQMSYNDGLIDFYGRPGWERRCLLSGPSSIAAK